MGCSRQSRPIRYLSFLFPGYQSGPVFLCLKKKKGAKGLFCQATLAVQGAVSAQCTHSCFPVSLAQTARAKFPDKSVFLSSPPPKQIPSHPRKRAATTGLGRGGRGSFRSSLWHLEHGCHVPPRQPGLHQPVGVNTDPGALLSSKGSQNPSGWKRPRRSSSPAVNPALLFPSFSRISWESKASCMCTLQDQQSDCWHPELSSCAVHSILTFSKIILGKPLILELFP